MIKRIVYSVGGGIFLGLFPIALFISALCTGDEQVATFSILAIASFGAGFLCTMVLSARHKAELER